MAEVVNRRLNIYIDAAGAEEALTRLTKKEAELTKQIDKAKASGKDFTKEMEKLGQTRTQISNLEGVISGKMLPSIRQAESAVSKLRKELKQLPSDSDAARQKLVQFKQAEATLRAVKDQAFGVSKALDGIKKDRGIRQVLDNAFGFFIGGGLLGAVSALTTGIGQFFSESITGALEAEKATNRLKSTLDNLGRADVFGRLVEKAEALQESFGFLDDEEILGVFEQLITYGKLTEAQINDLTPVIIDFAAKAQIELGQATSVVIKALEGNSKALKEYGIDVAGAKDSTEAFGIIMQQLKPKVEGAAEAFGETTAGQIAKTRQEIDNLKEDIGTDLLPVIKSFYSFISGAIDGVKTLIEIVRTAGDTTKFSFFDRVRLFLGDRRILNKVAAERAIAGNPSSLAPGEEAARQEADDRTSLTGVIGLGDKESPQEIQARLERNKKEREAAKKHLDDMREKYKQWSATVKGEALDAEMGEIFAAFRKINDEADKQLAQLKEFQKQGLVSAADVEELTGAINDILNAQREALQKKFNLNPVRIPVEPTIDINAVTEADGKSFGEQVFEGLSKTTKALEEPTWLDKNVEKMLEWSNLVSDIFTTVANVRAQADQDAFNQEVSNYDKRKEGLKKMLESNSISQKEYDRRLAKIEASQEKRRQEFAKKQFERDKKASIIQANINGAQAVLSTLSRFGPPTYPNFLAIAAMAVTVATTAAQLAAIRNSKPPQFEHGGFIPEGSSHKQGGISLIDNRTGARLGEVEGGEPIISKRVYAQNKGTIDAMLNPSWKNSSVSPINIPRLNSSMQQRYFADGGFLPAPFEGNDQMTALMRRLEERLNQPMEAYVVYGSYEAKDRKLRAIRNSGIIR